MKTADKIIHQVCNTLEVRYAAVQGPSRIRELADARHIICYLLRKHTTLSQRQIGNRLGGRDHSTVNNSIAVARSMIAVRDKIFMKKLAAVEVEIKTEVEVETEDEVEIKTETGDVRLEDEDEGGISTGSTNLQLH